MEHASALVGILELITLQIPREDTAAILHSVEWGYRSSWKNFQAITFKPNILEGSSYV